MTRKSPIHHQVRTHQRMGNVVNSYWRGKGERKPKLVKPHVGHVQAKNSQFYAVISYAESPTESFPVASSNYPDAVELAMLSRRSMASPLQVEVKKL